MASFDFEKLYKDAYGKVKETKSTEDWAKFGYDDPRIWEKDFRNGQTDLFWLSVDLLDLALVEAIHRPITDDFFIKKNPYVEAKNWRLAVSHQSTVKNRMLLYPRGTFKSSIDMADIVQWIICFPNIRTIYMTAEETLANDFVRQVKHYFQVPENTKMTRFQMLYADHCVSAKRKEADDQFLSPARTEQQPQPTLLALSLGMSTAGKHADVAKFDDCVSNKNSGPKSTPDQRKIVADEIKSARPIIDLYGYRDYVGTYWDSADAYVALEETISDLKVLKAPAWEVKPGARKKQIQDLTEEDVTLLFPVDRNEVPRLTFKALMDEYKVDAFIFSCQYLLNPALTKIVKFTDQMIRKQIIPSEEFPQDGTYFTASVWDLATTDGKKSDRSCGMAGKFTIAGPLAGRLFICEIIRGRYSKSELPFQISNQANRWRPLKNFGIEKPPAHDFLENDIMRALQKVGYPDAPSIEWIPIENIKGAKNERAAELESLFIDGRVFFSADIPADVMNEVIKEFVNFKAGTNRKDDSIDTCARLARYLPKDIAVPQSEQEKQTAAWDLLKQKQQHERMFPPNESKDSPLWKRDGYDRQELVTPAPTEWEGLPIFQNPEEQIYGT
jgi:predicted phage terminase large subunit-like protein